MTAFKVASTPVFDAERRLSRRYRRMAAVLLALLWLAGPTAGRAGGRAYDDDAPLRSLPETLVHAQEVMLGETLEVSEDRRRLTVRILLTAKDRLQEGEELTLPHPRLATTQGFVRFVPGSRYVYVLFKGVDDEWRTVELGELATFPVREDRVLIPAFYEPGVTLPAEGAPLQISLGAFFGFLGVCREGSEPACREGLVNAIGH